MQSNECEAMTRALCFAFASALLCVGAPMFVIGGTLVLLADALFGRANGRRWV